MRNKILFATVLCLIFKQEVIAQWKQLPNLSKSVISIWHSNGKILVGTDTGIYYTSNSGSTWNVSTGIVSPAKSFTKDGSKLLVSSYEKLYQSNNDGVSWTALPTIYTYQSANKIVLGDTNYVVGMNGNGAWFSDDYGTSWWSSSTSWQGKNTDIVIKRNLLIASYQGSGYLQASSNDGKTWYNPGGNGIRIGSDSSFQDIYCLGVKNDSVLIAGTKNGINGTQYDGVYFSYDNGNNWTKKINGITTTAINSIAVTGNIIFVGTNGGGVFYSTDDGYKWYELNMGLTNLTINKLYMDGSTLYAGVPDGVFKIDICNLLKNTSTLNAVGSSTILSGDSVKLLANLSGINYQWFIDESLVLNSNNSFLFAKSSGNYKAVISYSSNCIDTTNIVSVIVNPDMLNDNIIPINSFKLYPNPSSGVVFLDFTSSDFFENSQILFYNLTGSLINSLPILKTQTQYTTFELQSGIYYCVIQNGNSKSKPHKLIVIK